MKITHFQSRIWLYVLIMGLLLAACTPITPEAAAPADSSGAADAPAIGMANPASVNCGDKGGTLTIEKRGDGGEIGVCTFADNLQCEEWAMFRGECPIGGIMVTGYVTDAARYCAITGGQYTVDEAASAGAEQEQGTCALPDGQTCDVWDYYNGECPSADGSAATDDSAASDDADAAADAPAESLAIGMANPASVNCGDKGGTLTIEKRGDDGEIGVCTFEDNLQCEEWAMFRGECPVGGVKVTGYATDAARYCAITGGQYTVDEAASAGADQEQGTCTLPDGQTCDVWAYYNGECPPVDGSAATDDATTDDAAAPADSTMVGMANPASVNCADQGGTLTIETRADGGEYGVCTFEENMECEEWALFRGECPVGGVDVSGYATVAARYCAIRGGQYTVDEAASAKNDQQQGACTLPDGQTCDVWDYYTGWCPVADDMVAADDTASADDTEAADAEAADASPAVGLANPASVNCTEQGGTLTIEKRGDGGEIGVCSFEDNRQCEEWALFNGDCPYGGVKVTGYVTDAVRYCAITGGEYTVDEAASANSDQEQGTCALPDGTTCDVWDYYNGKCPADGSASTDEVSSTQASDAANVDPFYYCSTVGTDDSPTIEKVGNELPPAIVNGMIDQDVISADAPESIQQGAYWRCMDGNVYVCVVGANIPCTSKANTSETPTDEMNQWCSDNADSDFIPASVTGRATVYSWKCDGTDATVDQQVFTPDTEGYISDFWTELTPPTNEG